MMHLVLGVRKESDGVRLLRLLLHRYGLYSNYRMDFIYEESPPSKILDRVNLLAMARVRLETVWLQDPGVIVGLGWMPCELLTGRGKTKLKTCVGTKWKYVGNIARTPWISYDPDACLYDPALVVDIAAVLVAAGKEEGHLMQIIKNEALHQMQDIWRRYI